MISLSARANNRRAVPLKAQTAGKFIPPEHVKNGEERLVVLNAITKSVVDGERDKHRTHVFTYKGRSVTKMYNTAWRRAREAADLPQLRVHDLKHTFGRRLRAAGVSLEARKVLLGHTNGDITSHYSAPELEELIGAAAKVCKGTHAKLTHSRCCDVGPRKSRDQKVHGIERLGWWLWLDLNQRPQHYECVQRTFAEPRT